MMARVARSKGNVILTGETGTGKELFARAIHKNSDRKNAGMVVVDCTNLPKELRESLLLGTSKGLLPGLMNPKTGCSRMLTGNCFLDEIAELAMPLQKSMLRVLQEGRFRPVGSNTEVTSNFRVIAATNQKLSDMVAHGTFRKDLYFRLNAHCIHLHALRDRTEDIAILARHYTGKICKEYAIGRKTLSRELLRVLEGYSWPGNVRELVNAMYVCIDNSLNEQTVYPHHLPLISVLQWQNLHSRSMVMGTKIMMSWKIPPWERRISNRIYQNSSLKIYRPLRMCAIRRFQALS